MCRPIVMRKVRRPKMSLVRGLVLVLMEIVSVRVLALVLVQVPRNCLILVHVRNDKS
jgi:hypothetical protein